jgi:hypothetical protein
MTLEHRVIASIDDLVRVHVVCTACGTAIVHALATYTDHAVVCPNCRAPWFPSPRDHHEIAAALGRLLDAIKTLQTQPPATFRLELDFGSVTSERPARDA